MWGFKPPMCENKVQGVLHPGLQLERPRDRAVGLPSEGVTLPRRQPPHALADSAPLETVYVENAGQSLDRWRRALREVKGWGQHPQILLDIGLSMTSGDALSYSSPAPPLLSSTHHPLASLPHAMSSLYPSVCLASPTHRWRASTSAVDHDIACSAFSTSLGTRRFYCRVGLISGSKISTTQSSWKGISFSTHISFFFKWNVKVFFLLKC